MNDTDYDVRIRELESQLQAREDAIQCQICMERDKNMLFLCGHGACKECSERIEVCHICRTVIQNRIPIYQWPIRNHRVRTQAAFKWQVSCVVTRLNSTRKSARRPGISSFNYEKQWCYVCFVHLKYNSLPASLKQVHVITKFNSPLFSFLQQTLPLLHFVAPAFLTKCNTERDNCLIIQRRKSLVHFTEFVTGKRKTWT